MSRPAIPPAKDVTTYIGDGARIAAILLIWGIIAAFFTYVIGTVGYPGSLLGSIGPHIGGVLAVVGVLNAVLFVLYRTIDYWQQF